MASVERPPPSAAISWSGKNSAIYICLVMFPCGYVRILLPIAICTVIFVTLSPNKRTTAGLFILISILNEGGVRAESRARACTLNFTLIGMYKENLREIVLTQGLIHPDLFVRRSFPDFGVRKVLVRNPRKS